MPNDQLKRPRHKPSKKSHRSAYDAILEKRISIEISGKSRKVGPKEALQLKTLQDAFNGKIPAARRVLKWIDESDAAKKSYQAVSLPVMIQAENQRPSSIDDALLLLGIATTTGPLDQTGQPHLSLQTWAFQEGIDRFRKPLDRQATRDLCEHVDNPDAIRWPKGLENG